MDWLGSLQDSSEASTESKLLENSINNKLNISQNTEAQKHQRTDSTEESFRLPPPLLRRYKCELRKSCVNRLVDNYLKKTEENENEMPTARETNTCTNKIISSTPFPTNNNKMTLEESCFVSPIHNSIRRKTTNDQTVDDIKNCSTTSRVNQVKSSRGKSNLTVEKAPEIESKSKKERAVKNPYAISDGRYAMRVNKKQVKSMLLTSNEKSQTRRSLNKRRCMSTVVDNNVFKKHNAIRTYATLDPDRRRTFIERTDVCLNDKAFDFDEEWTCEELPTVECQNYSGDFQFLMPLSPIRKQNNKVVILGNVKIKSSQMELISKCSVLSKNNKSGINLRSGKTSLYQSYKDPDPVEQPYINFTPTSEVEFTKPTKSPARRKPVKTDITIHDNSSKIQEPTQNSTPTSQEEFAKPTKPPARGRPKIRDVTIQDNYSINSENHQMIQEPIEESTASVIEFVKPTKRATRGRPKNRYVTIQDNYSINSENHQMIQEPIEESTASAIEFVKPTKRPTRGRPKKNDTLINEKPETNSPIAKEPIEESPASAIESKRPTRGRPNKNDTLINEKPEINSQIAKDIPQTKSDSKNISSVTKPKGRPRIANAVQVQYISTSESTLDSLGRTRSATKANVLMSDVTSSTMSKSTRNKSLLSFVNLWITGGTLRPNCSNDIENIKRSSKQKYERTKTISTISKKKRVTKNVSRRSDNLKTILEESQLLRERHNINMELELAKQRPIASGDRSSSDYALPKDSGFPSDSPDVDSLEGNALLATPRSSVYVPNENSHKHFIFDSTSTENTDEPFTTHPLPKDSEVKVGQIKIKPGFRKSNVTLRNYNLTIFVHSGIGLYKLQNQSARLKPRRFVRAYDGHEYAIINDGKKDLDLIYFTYPSRK